MKEHTYGWYPSAKNVYEDRRIGTLTPYQLEALYRFKDSKYYQPPVTPPEQRTPKPPRPSPGPGGRPQSTSQMPADYDQTQHLQLRVTSAPIHTAYKPPPRLNLPTPQQCWSTHVPETEITVAPAQYSPIPNVAPSPPPSRISAPSPPKSTTPVPARATPVRQSPAPSPKVTPQPVGKTVRIQSATVRRETPSKPQRPVKSAGPVRPSPSPVASPVQVPPVFCEWPYPCGDVNYDITEDVSQDIPSDRRVILERPAAPSPASFHKRTPSRTSIQSPCGKPPSGRKTPQRPKAPSPYKMDYRLEIDQRAKTPDYTEETRKHGWMMEVHGDPLKLKKVSKRLPYTVKCDEPETERDPPNIHMENIETFFLNTIPRRPMAFTIDKEWISEVIHKKRMEMQKKHGLNYRYKNFGFVY